MASTDAKKLASITTDVEELVTEALVELKQFVRQGEYTNQDIAMARIMTSWMSTYARLKTAEGAQNATTFMMARELANDKNELRAYIAAAMPDHAVVKALKEPVAA